MERTFEDKPAVRTQTPLLVGITAPSGGGKTFSMLRMLSGMQEVYGGEIGIIDTEARRALHYADRFKFRHLDMKAPFGPLDYLAAIRHFVSKGITLIGADSMTHEHNGTGGVMDQSDAWLTAKYGDNEKDRQKNFLASLKEPKRQRMQLTNGILQMGINAVFCYRAHEKVKPIPGEGIKNMGWQPETTSALVYEMTTRFLLLPGADGRPDFATNDQTPAERMLTKNPEQFRDWYKQGIQIDEALGRRLAEWSKGIGPAPTTAPAPLADLPEAWSSWSDEERGENRATKGTAALGAWWATVPVGPSKKALAAKLDEWKATAAKIGA